jgi:hypothetical protein
MGEVNLGGVFFPSMLLWALLALAIAWLLRRLLASAGLYRFVWHRALFDLALTVLLFGGTVAIAAHIVGP